MNKTIRLVPLTADDAAVIRLWPSYPDHLRDLDYALRASGWLDEFPASEHTQRFAAWRDATLVGFSLLTDIKNSAAEFYIALHPQHIGAGVGHMITVQTLSIGFAELGLQRIYLKVRDWHVRGKTLYEHVGFKVTGSHAQSLQGKIVNFIDMEIRADEFVSIDLHRDDGIHR